MGGARYGNFIEEAPTGAVEDDLPVYQYFQTKADFHGAEFEASYEAWRGATRSIRLETTFDWVHGDTDAGVPARIPPWALGGSVVWTAPRVETTLEVRRVAEQDRVADVRTAHRRLYGGQPEGHVQADRGLAPAAVRRRPQPDQRGDPRARLVPQGHRPVARPLGAGGRGLEVLAIARKMDRRFPTSRVLSETAAPT